MAYLDNFYFELHGDESKPKLVLLHGLMGYASNWRKIVQKLVSQYHILVYDQRGHGKSFHPSTGYTPEDYAQDLNLILDELGWSQTFLVGHSMGGRNALAFALQFPQRVRALVIEDITPSRPAGQPSRTEQFIKSVPTPFENRRVAKEFFLNDFVHMFIDHPHIQTTGQFLYSNIIELDDGQAAWRFYLPGILQSIRESSTRDRWEDLKRLAVPTLLIRGQDSDEVTPSEYQRVLAASPFIQGVEIPDAGHWVHFDQPELFVEAVEGFLAQVRMVTKGAL